MAGLHAGSAADASARTTPALGQLKNCAAGKCWFQNMGGIDTTVPIDQTHIDSNGATVFCHLPKVRPIWSRTPPPPEVCEVLGKDQLAARARFDKNLKTAAFTVVAAALMGTLGGGFGAAAVGALIGFGLCRYFLK